MQIDLPIPDSLWPALRAFPRALIVGGSVRDHFLGFKPKDFDVEIYGMSPDEIEAALGAFGQVKAAGKSFGVLKLTTADGNTYDFSAARRDNRMPGQKGHKAFSMEFDKSLTEIEAAARRDLTINALAWNPKNGEVLDFYQGLQDLEKRVLRHTTTHFAEDALRPLRLFQFAARFDFQVDPGTAKLCRMMAHQCRDLSKERIGEEFNKFILKGKNHLNGYKVLAEIGWLTQFPELAALDGFPQDQEFHPEGDVLTHTGLTQTALSRLPRYQALPDSDRLAIGYGMMTHDFGKPITSKLEYKPKLKRDAIVSPGHDKAGVPLAARFLDGLMVSNETKARAMALTEFHMEHLQVKTDAQVRRLAVQLGRETIEGLGMVVEGDMSGRPPLPARQAEDMQKILDRAEALGCRHGRQEPVLLGRDIIQWGIKPGPAVGVLVNAAYEAQVKGHITDRDTAEAWFRQHRAPILEEAQLAPQRLFSGDDLQAVGMTAGPGLGWLHRELYDQQLDGKIKDRPAAVAFIREKAEVYSVPHESLARLEAIASSAPPQITQKR